jgi:hypothetical protein
VCVALAPRSRPGTATHATCDSNLSSGNHDMPRLSTFACPNDEPIHGLADVPLRRLPTGIKCGTLAPRSQTRHTQHHNFSYTNTLTADKLRTCISWWLSSDGAHLRAHRSLRYTTSNGYWVWHPAHHSQTTHGNTHCHCLRLKPRQRQPRHAHRLSTFAYLNDALMRPSTRCRHTSTPPPNGY